MTAHNEGSVALAKAMFQRGFYVGVVFGVMLGLCPFPRCNFTTRKGVETMFRHAHGSGIKAHQ